MLMVHTDKKSEEISLKCSQIAQQFRLTPREYELMLNLSLNGSSNKDLARALVITEKTVNVHMTNLLRKTKTKSTRELMSLVIASFLSDATG